MQDFRRKDISDPSFSAADFRLQLTGGRLRWFAAVLSAVSAGLFIYLLTQGEKASLDFPFQIHGRAALAVVGSTFLVWAAIATVNWKNWFRRTVLHQNIIATAEDGLGQLEMHQPSGDRFELAVADSITFQGKPDNVGFGMALILDRILAMRYEPDGFTQKDGFKLYRYKKMR